MNIWYSEDQEKKAIEHRKSDRKNEKRMTGMNYTVELTGDEKLEVEQSFEIECQPNGQPWQWNRILLDYLLNFVTYCEESGGKWG